MERQHHRQVKPPGQVSGAHHRQRRDLLQSGPHFAYPNLQPKVQMAVIEPHDQLLLGAAQNRKRPDHFSRTGTLISRGLQPERGHQPMPQLQQTLHPDRRAAHRTPRRLFGIQVLSRDKLLETIKKLRPCQQCLGSCGICIDLCHLDLLCPASLRPPGTPANVTLRRATTPGRNSPAPALSDHPAARAVAPPRRNSPDQATPDKPRAAPAIPCR